MMPSVMPTDGAAMMPPVALTEGAAAEVVVGLAIIVQIFRTRRSVSIDEPNLLKY